jgi:predicted nucleic acid-binding protein
MVFARAQGIDPNCYEATSVALVEALGCPPLTGDARLAASPGLRGKLRLITARSPLACRG